MDDQQVIGRINEIAHEEHALWEKEGRGEATEAEQERLKELAVTLDQCWDLLHQRRAGGPPGRTPTTRASAIRGPSRATRANPLGVDPSAHPIVGVVRDAIEDMIGPSLVGSVRLRLARDG